MCWTKMLLSKLVSVASEPNECWPEKYFLYMTPQRCFAVVVSMDENAVFFLKDYVRMMYTSIPVNAHAPIKDGTVSIVAL